MGLYDQRPGFNTAILTGFAMLIPASLSRLLLARSGYFSESASDAVTGLLYGITIGCFLLGMARQRKAR